MLSPDLEMTSFTLHLVQYTLSRRCHCPPLDDDACVIYLMRAALQSIGEQPLPFSSSVVSQIILVLSLEGAGVDAPAAAALCLPRFCSSMCEATRCQENGRAKS